MSDVVELPDYEGPAFVRSISNVRAQLYVVDPPADTPYGLVKWKGRLRDRLGWARRYDVDRGAEEQLMFGDTLVLELPEYETGFEAVIDGVWYLEPDRLSRFPSTAVDVLGLGPPPFAARPGPASPPDADVREPRHPAPTRPPTSIRLPMNQ